MTGIKLIVDYSRPRQEKIVAMESSYVMDSVVRNAIYFPSARGEGKKEVYVNLIKFSRGLRTGEGVVKELDCPPATIDELLVFGEKYSRNRYDDIYCNVVALGSPAKCPDGKLLVPYISGTRRQSYLNLGPIETYWANHFSYLVLCE